MKDPLHGPAVPARLLLALFVALVGLGCQTTLRPTTDFDTSVDFSAMQTFGWIDPNPLIRTATQRPLSPLVQERLMAATRTALTGRGLRFVDNVEDADLAVAFTIGSREGLRITNVPSSSFSRGSMSRRDSHWRRGYWGRPQNTVQTRQYTEGQLAIDLFDVANAVPVWHGTVSRRVTRQERGEPDEALREAVVAIVNEFPPS